MLTLDALNELARAITWFALGFGVRAVMFSPFAAGWWLDGDDGN